MHPKRIHLIIHLLEFLSLKILFFSLLFSAAADWRIQIFVLFYFLRINAHSFVAADFRAAEGCLLTVDTRYNLINLSD